MELSRLLRNCGMRVGNFRRIEALLYLIESFIKIFARKFLKKPAELSTGFKSIHSNDIQRDLSRTLPKTRSTAKPYSKDNLASMVCSLVQHFRDILEVRRGLSH